MQTTPSLTFAIAIAVGMLAQSLAHHLRVPAIVLLLLAGVALGPDLLGVVQPDLLGHGLEIIVALSVAVILFEGGLSLNLSRIRGEALVIRRLITVGALVSAVGGALAAHLFMGWTWRISILFGTLVMVTGPTVVTPLLRRIRVNRNVHTILEAEGVLIDPVGAITAVVALEVALAWSGSYSVAGLIGIPQRLLAGAAIGGAGGYLIGRLLRSKEIVPEGLENVFTLSLVLGLFSISNAVLAESGIMTVVAAGFVVGNMRTRLDRELREFKESLTVLLVGLLFVLLAADVRVGEVVSLGWGGVATVLALMLVARPLGVAASTYGSTLSVRERAFVAWLGPRGIVAAAVASLFVHALEGAGVPDAAELRALVFLVIAMTVVIQGLSGGPLAKLLGVARPRAGYLIVGANAIGRVLARALEATGENVIIMDTNASNVRAAREEGLRVLLGNASDEERLLRADVEGRRGFLAATSNEGVNFLLARRAREHHKVPLAAVLVHHGKAGVSPAAVQEVGATVLFGHSVELERWLDRLTRGGATLKRWRFTGEKPDLDPEEATAGAGLLPLTVTRGGATRPMASDVELRAGDVVTFAVDPQAQDAAIARLRERGWEPQPAPEETESAVGA